MPPGKEGKITLSIAHTDSYAGEVKKSAVVQTNDPSMPSFTLTLVVFFKPVVLPAPPPATPDRTPQANNSQIKRFGQFEIKPGNSWKAVTLFQYPSRTDIDIINREALPAKIIRIDKGGDYFNIALQTIVEERYYRLSIDTNHDLAPGDYKQTVTVFVSKGTPRSFPINLEVSVNPLVYVNPSKIVLRHISIKDGEPLSNLTEITIQRARLPGFEISKATSTLPFIKLDIIPQEPGRLYRIKLSIDRSAIPAGDFSGNIHLDTNDLASKSIDVPIEGSFDK